MGLEDDNSDDKSLAGTTTTLFHNNSAGNRVVEIQYPPKIKQWQWKITNSLMIYSIKTSIDRDFPSQPCLITRG
jgi:hypothetical protein